MSAMCDCRLHRIDAVSNQVHHDLLQLHAISHDLGTIPIVLLTGDPVGSCRKPVSTGGQYYRALLVRDPVPNLSVKNVRVAVLRASD
jgi:hypothetical protein